MKKILALLLAALMLMGIMAGCGNNDEQTTTAGKENVGNNDDTTAGEEPIEMRTIKILCTRNQQTMYEYMDYDNWENNETYQVFKEELAKRGLQLEFEVIDSEQYADAISTRLIAGVDLPDIILNPGLSNTEALDLGRAGVVADVMAMINQYDDDGSIMEYMSKVSGDSLGTIIDDGKMYWFPYTYGVFYTDDDGNVLDNCYGTSLIGLSIRKDWLEAVDMEYQYSYTPDELADALIAIYNGDANGNGVSDEVLHNFRCDFKTGFEAGFGLVYGIVNAANDGEGIRCNVYSENFPEYIKFMQKLYNAGVLSTEVLNGVEVLNSNRGSVTRGYCSQTWLEEGIVGFEDTAVYAPFVIDDGNVENGWGMTYVDQTQNVLGMWFVNAETKNAEAIVDLMDFVYSEEYSLMCMYGLEGKNYTVNEDGTITALKTELAEGEVPTVWALESTIASNALPNNVYQIKSKSDVIAAAENPAYQCKIDFIEWAWDNSDTMVYCYYDPQLAIPTEEETEIINTYTSPVKTYITELVLDLIIGERSLDDLDTYIKELEEAGLTQLMEAYQARYDRYQESLKVVD